MYIFSPGIWDKVLKVPSLCLRGISEPTVINNESNRVLVCSATDGGYDIVRKSPALLFYYYYYYFSPFQTKISCTHTIIFMVFFPCDTSFVQL